jgi:uncharacterized membrane protein YqjE
MAANGVVSTGSGNAAEPSLPELLSATTRDLSELMRSEVELAKVELKEEAKSAAQAGALLGAGGLLGYLALTLVAFAAAWGLAEVLPEGIAFLIVAVVVAVAAAICLMAGKQRLSNVTPVPEQTVETLQEDVQWAKQQLS